MFIYFYKSDKDEVCKKYEKDVLADNEIKEGLQQYVLVKLPTNYVFTKNKKKTPLIKHNAFQYMYERPGISIIDLKYKGKSHYGHVVNCYAFSKRFQYGKKATKTIFNLPAGSITQRTMTYAVRMHPEAPQSTNGKANSMLFKESESHSQHQADINVQGHHNWESRFQTISSNLGNGLLATEVCAESWPGEELVEAAVECVHCWRQSSGHWRSVNRFQPQFGYDIRLGSNGIWYGTGIFGNHN